MAIFFQCQKKKKVFVSNKGKILSFLFLLLCSDHWCEDMMRGLWHLYCDSNLRPDKNPKTAEQDIVAQIP